MRLGRWYVIYLLNIIANNIAIPNAIATPGFSIKAFAIPPKNPVIL